MPRAPVLRNTCHGPRTSIPQRVGCLPPHTDRVQQRLFAGVRALVLLGASVVVVVIGLGLFGVATVQLLKAVFGLLLLHLQENLVEVRVGDRDTAVAREDDDDVVYWYSFSNHYTKRAFTQP